MRKFPCGDSRRIQSGIGKCLAFNTQNNKHIAGLARDAQPLREH